MTRSASAITYNKTALWLNTLERHLGMGTLPANKAVTAGMDGKVVAKNAVGVVIKMIFEDGFFHADPHPGNVLILGTPR